MTEVRKKEENIFINIAFNIAIPVFILNKASNRLGENGPLLALGLALLFPIGYWIYDFITRKKNNWLTWLGVINLLLTGGLAVLKLSGPWFAVKEAAFPFVIGLGVFWTSRYGTPLIRTMMWNPAVIAVEKVDEAVRSLNQTEALKKLFQQTTLYFSLSFFFSAAMNFYLAIRIFSPIDPLLSESEKQTLLNEQIAKMTYQGWIMIALPMTILMMAVVWYLISRVQKLSGLSMDDILHDGKKKAP